MPHNEQNLADAEATDAGRGDAPIVSLKDVHKSFGTNRVLSGIDLQIERGKTTVILGPSGTGKSVMLKHIVGLIKPDRGEVYFEGERVDTLKEPGLVEVRKRIGYMFQLGALFDSMTVAENIAFPLVEHTKMDGAQRMASVHRVLRLVGLADYENMMPAELSGGQQRRVALARAVVLEPCMVLYDEPTTGLDPITTHSVDSMIMKAKEEHGVTSVVISHDIQSAFEVADRVVFLHDGSVVAEGPPDVFRASEHEAVREFLGAWSTAS